LEAEFQFPVPVVKKVLAARADRVVGQDPVAILDPAAIQDPAADHVALVGRARVAVLPAVPPAVGYSPKHAAVRGVSPVWILPGSPGWPPISTDPAAVLACPAVDLGAVEI